MDIAALGLSVKFDQVEGATAALKEQTKAASASERAAQQWGLANKEAGRTADDFSKRVQATIRNLEFERQQMARTAAEQERFTALRRAGVSASSAEGQAISEHIRQLQAQREAQKAAAESARLAQQQAAGFAALAKQQAAEQAAAAQAVAQAKAVEMRAAQARQAQADALVAKQAAHEAQRKAVVQSTIADINFETQQLGRNAIQRERHLALRRAGVVAESAEGKAVLASVAALQAQRAAIEGQSKALTSTSQASSVAAAGFGSLLGLLGPLAAAFTVVAIAQKAWQAGMNAGALGEQAEQIGITAEALQALRSVALQSGVSVEQLDGGLTKLQRAMGAANDGNDEMIDKFKKMGVQLLDADKQLRSPTDVLPELARGLLNVSSSTERNALMMEFLGKSGMKMNTMLGVLAGGMGALTEEARKNGQIVSQETIDAWDKLDDQLTLTKTAASNAFAALGAPIATEALALVSRLLNDILGNLDRLRKEAASGAGGARAAGAGVKSDISVLEDRLAAARQLAQINNNSMNRSSVAALESQIARAREVEQSIKTAIAVQEDVSGANQGSGPPQRLDFFDRTTGGQPTGNKSKSGKSDPYAKAIESAREYLLSKKAETEAVGQTVLAAAQLKHQQDLLNKATGEGKTLSDAQKAALQALAGQMAEADDKLATAKFMDDARTKGQEFLAQQEMERQALFMSAQAADALRFSTEMLNAAKRQGTELTPAHVEAIKATADAMAASKAQTDQMKEIVGLGRDVFKGFFSDMREGLMNGQTIWQSFGDAAVNALNRIAEKLIEMAATQLFEAAFPSGGGGGGGGGLGGLIGGLFGGGSSGTASGIFDGLMGSSFFPTFAKGAAFRAGNVIPFARGDVFNSPTYFPMSGGRRGVMAEAGEEAIMPLHRGSDGGLGVRMAGGRGAAPQPVVVHVYANEGFVTATAEGAAVRVVNKAAPGIESRAVKRANDQAPAAVDRATALGEGDWRFARA